MLDQELRVGRRLATAVLVMVGLAACGDDPGEEAQPAEAAAGVSREEMVGQATPMTLEEAESLGIVDTTVRVAPPVGPDSLPVYNPSNLPDDSVR